MVVYPRWRGELDRTASVVSSGSGLSPLARGTHRPRTTIRANRRFIPAGAGNTTVQTAGYYFFAVYPRWRGEHNVRLSPLCVVAGLSPLARGTLHGFGFLFDGRRFIPAGAGNTYIRAKNKATATVYPRWRGEHHKETILRFVQVGLSPLARGTLLQCQQSFPDCRFIPAGAGNTRRWHRQTPVLSVYPRWRGEHYRDRFWNLQRGGLSPLARGTPVSGLSDDICARFIPAGAGNTLNITYY